MSEPPRLGQPSPGAQRLRIVLWLVAVALGPVLWRTVHPVPGPSPARPAAKAPVAESPASPAPAAPASPSASNPGAVPGSIPIDEEHLFAGQINRQGKPVGFHSRPGGQDPATARLVKVLDRPNGAGVYTARVEIQDPRSGRWLEKTSTFYPDGMGRSEVLGAILHAYASRVGEGERFRGPSGTGFTIEGYYQNGRIRTAYPIYARR